MELGEWWTDFADANMDERKAMLQPDTVPRKRKRRRKPAANRTPAENHLESNES
jgi:poly(A) polymerase